jgi:hypothetical protein
VAEFYHWTLTARIPITLLLALCVITQTIAAVLSHYQRHSREKLFVTLLEVFILFQIIVLSMMHGLGLHTHSESLIVLSGYIELRYFAAITVSLLACIVAIYIKKARPLLIIVFSCLTLPLTETAGGGAYPWLYIAALLYWLSRGVYAGFFRNREIKTNISALSVKSAVDSLNSGVLFGEPDGFILLSNVKMQQIMITITGQVQRNGLYFYEYLQRGEFRNGCQKAAIEGQLVCLLPDHTAWLFIMTKLRINNKRYIQLTGSDISAQWALTADLRQRQYMLKSRGEKLSDMIANLYIMSRERELQKAKLRAHDIMSQRLTVLLRALRGEQPLDFGLIRAQSQGLFEDLTDNKITLLAQDQFENLQETFKILGVEILLEGTLPGDDSIGQLFVDVISEGAANAVRHGFATKITVKTGCSEFGWHLELSDNGRPPLLPVTEGGGISGLRKKAERYGGTLEVVAQPGFMLKLDLAEVDWDV